MRSSKYDAAMLSPIVRSSRSFAEVMRKLGLPPSGGNYREIAARIRHAAIDISHFGSRTIAARCAAMPRVLLEGLVPQCLSIAQVLAKLELPTEGRAHRELARRIRELGIDTTHFRGQGWSRGETRNTHPSVERARQRNRYPDDAVFVENSPLFKGALLTKRLIALGEPYRCAWCDVVEWRGRREQRQSPREPALPVSELPLADGHLLQSAPLVAIRQHTRAWRNW